MLAFDDLSESALRAVVADIIRPEKRPRVEDELHSTIDEIKALEAKKRTRRSTEYVPRGPTGRMAEEFFIARFCAGSTPFEGDLKDRRTMESGLFEISRQLSRTLVEIKVVAIS
jgi:hypothetical protein